MNPPPHAILLWSDGRAVFALLPLSSGEGFHTVSFPFHEQGLSRALDLLRNHVPTPTPPREAIVRGFTLNTRAAHRILGKVKK